MSADNIAKEVTKRLSIPASRKGIYDDIDALNDYWDTVNDARRIEKDENSKGYYLATLL